jgi:adenylate cyclase, class 2
MAHPASNLEIEIKLRLENARATKARLTRLGFSVVARRVFEINTIFDTPAGLLRGERKLLRLRQAGRRNTIAFKGPPIVSRYKSREELETECADSDSMSRILVSLGFTPAFRYEKYRTEYAKFGQPGAAMLDETPIGNYLELEGPPRWIDRTARALGFSSTDYVTASYGKLYLEYCQASGIQPTHMVFTREHQRS